MQELATRAQRRSPAGSISASMLPCLAVSPLSDLSSILPTLVTAGAPSERPHRVGGHALRHSARAVPRPCPDTSTCPPPGQNATLFLIEGGKEDAAFAQDFYTVVVNGVLHSWHEGYVPWIRFDPERVYRTFGKAWQGADGKGQLWEQLYESYCPNLQAWKDACPNVLVAPRKTVNWWYKYVGISAPWAVHSWYNYGSVPFHECLATKRLPEDGPIVTPVCAAEGKPWRPCASGKAWDGYCPAGKCTCDLFNDTLYGEWREKGAAVVSSAHVLRPSIAAQVNEAWRTLNPDGAAPVLGCHMRGSDKASGRRRVTPAEFEPYVADFFDAHPNGRVFVATESNEYAQIIRGAWRTRWGEKRVLMRDIGTRISGKRLNAMVYRDRQLEVLHDVFMDIQMMSRCDYFIHSASAVSEAVIFSNFKLHEASVHLEYQHDSTRSGSPRDAPWRTSRTRRDSDGRRQYPMIDHAKCDLSMDAVLGCRTTVLPHHRGG